MAISGAIAAAWRRRAAGVGVIVVSAVVAISCGKTSDAEGDGRLDGSALPESAAGAAGAGAAPDDAAAPGGTASGGTAGVPASEPPPSHEACDGGACAQCPAPGAGNCAAGRSPQWARDPATGTCCPYWRACQTPEGWPAFATQEECESSCRCQDVTPDDLSMIDTLGLAAFATERTTLTCWCSDHDCPESLVDVVAGVCDEVPSSAMSLAVGCGMIAVRFTNLTSSDRVFDATSGALIGIAQYADTITRPCRTYVTFAGVEFDCPGAVECPLCDGTRPRLTGCE